jgi:phosphonate transport system substrate-binding protein
VPSSSQVIIEGLKGGTIDLAYLSSSDLARNRDTASLLLAGEIDGKTTYESYWVALNDAQLESIAELRGKPVCFASRTSTSGFVVPLWDLHKAGSIAEEGHPEDFFGQGNVLFGTGYVSAIEKVLAGRGRRRRRLRTTCSTATSTSADEALLARVLDTQGPVPTHVLATRSDLDPARATPCGCAARDGQRRASRTARSSLRVAAGRGRDRGITWQSWLPAIEFASATQTGS